MPISLDGEIGTSFRCAVNIARGNISLFLSIRGECRGRRLDHRFRADQQIHVQPTMNHQKAFPNLPPTASLAESHPGSDHHSKSHARHRNHWRAPKLPAPLPKAAQMLTEDYSVSYSGPQQMDSANPTTRPDAGLTQSAGERIPYASRYRPASIPASQDHLAMFLGSAASSACLQIV